MTNVLPSGADPDTSLSTAVMPLCPSAPPGAADATLFGVVTGPVGYRRMRYLTKLQPVTSETLALAGPVRLGQVFRVAATCAGRQCTHFDGTNCRLAQRIVEFLPPVIDGIPPCRIRPTCRWWRQEGKAACQRCPEVTTEIANPTELQRRVASTGSTPGYLSPLPAGPTSAVEVEQMDTKDQRAVVSLPAVR